MEEYERTQKPGEKPSADEKNVAHTIGRSYTKSMSMGMTNDVIFKYVFGAKESIRILTDLVNAVLTDSGFTEIASLSLKNPITPRAANWLKGTELDILAEDKDGVQYDIEMQVSDEPNFKNRSLFYWARQYSGQLLKGDEYTGLKPVICINLIDFVLVKNPAIFHSCYMLADKNIPDAVLTKDLQIHFVELPKSRDFGGKLASWARLLRESDENATEEEMEVIIKKDEVMEEAYDRFQESLRDKRTFFDALMREKWQRDQISRKKAAERAEKAAEEAQKKLEQTEKNLEQTEKDLEQTEKDLEQTEKDLEQTEKDLEQTEKDLRRTERELGRVTRDAELAEQRGRFETARNMKADGLSAEAICKYTGLSLEEIADIQ